jgi:ribosomal protein S18 acetylase RimI-like enzyme
MSTRTLPNQLGFRAQITPSDCTHIRALTTGTGMFYPEEIEVAVELAEERLSKGLRSGYEFLFAERDGVVVGYVCYGPISLTVASWDLYWIAVDRAQQGRGVGAALVGRMETDIAARRGQQVYVETAGRDAYAPTRAFYRRLGYTVAAELPDFYAPGDAKVVFFKRLR